MTDDFKVNAWTVFEPFLKGNGNPYFIESLARDATRFAGFHISPATLMQALSCEIQPEYNEAAAIVDWLNDRFFPRLGIRQKFTLPELFPEQFKMPVLKDEVILILGRDAIAGKTASEKDVVHLFGQEGLNKLKALGYKPGDDGRYPIEGLLCLLLRNPELQLCIKPGDSVYFVEPVKVEIKADEAPEPEKPKKVKA